ncbi:hypothetical protein D9M71_418700 [compost metagenome]
MRGGAGDLELGQVQRGAVQAQQTGLFALLRQQHFSLGRQRQLCMATALGLALGQDPAVLVQHFQGNTLQGLAAFQGLSEHVQAVLVAMHRQADIAESEQRRRL